jgi:hypothetical protein
VIGRSLVNYPKPCYIFLAWLNLAFCPHFLTFTALVGERLEDNNKVAMDPIQPHVSDFVRRVPCKCSEDAQFVVSIYSEDQLEGLHNHESSS